MKVIYLFITFSILFATSPSNKQIHTLSLSESLYYFKIGKILKCGKFIHEKPTFANMINVSKNKYTMYKLGSNIFFMTPYPINGKIYTAVASKCILVK